MAGAWGPSTWGPSPQEQVAAERARVRAQRERADGLLSWLRLHPWVWVLCLLAAGFVVLGPWLHVLTPNASGVVSFLCHGGTAGASGCGSAPAGG